MPDPNYAAELKKLEDAIEAIKEAHESADGIEDITDQLNDLTDRIDDARSNPESLDASTYADLALDLMLVIPNNLPLPDGAKKAIEALASVLAAFIQAAAGMALTKLAYDFRKRLPAFNTPEEAAKNVAPTQAERAWLMTQYRLGTMTYFRDTRELEMPWDWLWRKFTGLFVGLLALMLLALVLLAVFVMGGFEMPPSATGIAQPSATSPGEATAGPTPLVTAQPTSQASPEPTVAATPPPLDFPRDELTAMELWDPIAQTWIDPPDDGMHSERGERPGYFPASVDLFEVAAAVIDASEAAVGRAFNSTVFDCATLVDGIRTICASGAPIPPGPLFVATARLAEPIPHDSSDGLLTYALVLEQDDDSSNNFRAQPPFTNDFYQGTDRWYELIYTPTTGWRLSVDRGETTSNARVAIWDDAVVFFVPMSEVGIDAPGYRLTAFASSDASFAPATSGGDVAPGPPDASWELAELSMTAP